MDLLSPQEVLSSLCGIYPDFQAEWEFGGENPYIQEDGSFSLHAVYMTFLPFFAEQARSSSEAQLSAVAALINAAVEAGGKSENAVATCFLEHAGQLRVREILSPLLSAAAKARFTA
jgi:hypothetical protein